MSTENFMTRITDPAERRQRIEYWSSRYSEADPIMRPEEETLQGSYPRCGDEGLRMPGKEKSPEEDEKFRQRHERMGSVMKTASPQDVERIGLTLETESAALSLRDTQSPEAEDRFSAALGALVEYDRRMGHPVADQTRDLQTAPPTPAEQAAWMLRDGRELNDSERTHQQQTDIFHARTRQDHLGLSKPGMDGDWSRPGRQAVIPQHMPDPRPRLAATQAVVQSMSSAPELSIAGGLTDRLSARRKSAQGM